VHVFIQVALETILLPILNYLWVLFLRAFWLAITVTEFSNLLFKIRISTDIVLTENIIATYKVTSQAECLLHCHKTEGCQSYNYEYTLTYNTEGKLGLCELNNKTMTSCPLSKVRKEGHGYFEEMNVPEKEV
jgi:hypothetical protein